LNKTRIIIIFLIQRLWFQVVHFVSDMVFQNIIISLPFHGLTFFSLISMPLFSPSHDLHRHEKTMSMLYAKIKILMKMIRWSWFILDNIRFHMSLLEQFQTWKNLAYSQINRHGKVYFWIFFLKKISQTYFKYFLHQFASDFS
jgi:hypothetical protein